MKLTKDEARILAGCLSGYKYDLIKNLETKEKQLRVLNELQKLEDKLTEAGVDKRRQGRRSQNDFSDLIKRYRSDNWYERKLKEQCGK